MPDWRWQLEQFEEEQRLDDQRLPSSTTRPFLHPRRCVTSIFPVALLFTASLVSPFVCIRLPPHENNTRATLSTSPAIPLHWLPRLVHLPCDTFVPCSIFVKLTAYDSPDISTQTLEHRPAAPPTSISIAPLSNPLVAPILTRRLHHVCTIRDP